MTIETAKKIKNDFNLITHPTEEQKFDFTEAMGFLIEETRNPEYMMELGGYYYDWRNFDLALKYYNMAAEFDFESAYECLGYIWYYGRTGMVDYEKAFEFFSKAMKKGNIVAEYKIADMYKNGYFVEKDYEKYKNIIKSMYSKVKDAHFLYEPLPEIYTRLARIHTEEGNIRLAIGLYRDAKDFLAQRIRYNPFFGNLNIMKWLIEDLYKLTEFDDTDMDFFDLYYVLKKPVTVTFIYNDETHTIKTVEENGLVSINLDDTKWYKTVDDFFQNAEINHTALTDIYEDLYDFELPHQND